MKISNLVPAFGFLLPQVLAAQTPQNANAKKAKSAKKPKKNLQPGLVGGFSFTLKPSVCYEWV